MSQFANWLVWFYLGIMKYYAGDCDGARHAWELSLEQANTPWAMRNLAVLAWEEKRFDHSADLYVVACRMRPSLLPLTVECGRTLIEVGRPRDWLTLLTELPPSIRTVGRIRLLEAQAALAIGDFQKVESIFAEEPVVHDLCEGKESLSHLWFDFHEQRLIAAENVPIDDALRARVRRDFPVPKEFDFRMHIE